MFFWAPNFLCYSWFCFSFSLLFFFFLFFFFFLQASQTFIFGERIHLISQPLNGNQYSQRRSSTLQMDFPLLANCSFETQFTGPGKGFWQDSWTVWFWSLRELEKPPSFMLWLFLSAMHHLDTSPSGAPLCLARLFARCQDGPGLSDLPQPAS